MSIRMGESEDIPLMESHAMKRVPAYSVLSWRTLLSIRTTAPEILSPLWKMISSMAIAVCGMVMSRMVEITNEKKLKGVNRVLMQVILFRLLKGRQWLGLGLVGNLLSFLLQAK